MIDCIDIDFKHFPLLKYYHSLPVSKGTYQVQRFLTQQISCREGNISVVFLEVHLLQLELIPHPTKRLN